MTRRRKQLIRAMQRTFRAIRRFDRSQDVAHLIRAVRSIGRTLNRQFSDEAARNGPETDITPLETGTYTFTAEFLRDELMYCSDRWGLRRYLRVVQYIGSAFSTVEDFSTLNPGGAGNKWASK